MKLEHWKSLKSVSYLPYRTVLKQNFAIVLYFWVLALLFFNGDFMKEVSVGVKRCVLQANIITKTFHTCHAYGHHYPLPF